MTPGRPTGGSLFHVQALARHATNLRLIGAIALTILGQVETWLVWAPDPDEADLALTGATRIAAALAIGVFTASFALPGKRRWLTLALALPAIVLSPDGPLDSGLALTLAIVAAPFLAATAARATSERFGVAALVAVAVILTWQTHPGTVENASDLLIVIAALAGPWLAGAALRIRQDREAALVARSEELEAHRARDVEAATASERRRIAIELHDIVAHAISVIVLQARGGRRALAGDPGATRESLDAIERTAADALAEMRRLVDVLGPGEASAGLEPQPGLDRVEELVEGVRAAGLVVELGVEGVPVRLPAGIDLAAFRIIQEALTNSLRHAGARTARVDIRYRPGSVELEVRDDGTGNVRPTPARATGRGTIGMRQRAALYGGTIEIGARPGGGFSVLARLPVQPEPA